jgi:hypothetical protein
MLLIHRRNIQQSNIFAQGVGATQEVINSLPIYYYRKKKQNETASDDIIANNITVVIDEPVPQSESSHSNPIITDQPTTITIPKPKKRRFTLFFRKTQDKTEQPQLDERTCQSLELDAVDANCSICLGDYDEIEQLRQLKCKHHFHVECIGNYIFYSR